MHSELLGNAIVVVSLGNIEQGVALLEGAGITLFLNGCFSGMKHITGNRKSSDLNIVFFVRFPFSLVS